MKATDLKQSRLEVRISEIDKKIFEKASRISGHKTLTSFVTYIVRKQAREIIEEKEKILASEKDKEVFFNAILANNKPNDKLKSATKKYLDLQVSR
ncbi:MAG: DUF1778 domain-containing protein [Flavobacteriaceae bacterium]|nr:DUF1778 domain-containing protein [Flavobacteriaceae bacterium]MDZ4147352.1 DUF1778 domain-containing protein [Flavobacteriaceae bacterium]